MKKCRRRKFRSILSIDRKERELQEEKEMKKKLLAVILAVACRMRK